MGLSHQHWITPTRLGVQVCFHSPTIKGLMCWDLHFFSAPGVKPHLTQYYFNHKAHSASRWFTLFPRRLDARDRQPVTSKTHTTADVLWVCYIVAQYGNSCFLHKCVCSEVITYNNISDYFTQWAYMVTTKQKNYWCKPSIKWGTKYIWQVWGTIINGLIQI